MSVCISGNCCTAATCDNLSSRYGKLLYHVVSFDKNRGLNPRSGLDQDLDMLVLVLEESLESMLDRIFK